MAFDPHRDQHRMRVLLLVASLLLLASLAVVAVREHARQRQKEVVELTHIDGGPDRCASCHLEVLTHPKKTHAEHDLGSMGCSGCHGGTPRALVKDAAHAWLGRGERDPSLTPFGIEVSCSRCHAIGIRGSEHLLHGAELYRGLGCALCHGGATQNGPLTGPELRRTSRLSADAIITKLRQPGAGSAMPSYDSILQPDPVAAAEIALLVQSLALPKLPTWQQRASRAAVSSVPMSTRCDVCHNGPGGKATGPYRHRCLLLQRDELTCQRCHQDTPLPTDKDCPRIQSERGACGICHGSEP